jgi:site-specific DNA recombinase
MDQTKVCQEVCQLLDDPERLEQAYRQQLASAASQEHPKEPAGLAAQLGKLRRGIARLIDSYAAGLIEKPDFQPRVTRLRERLQHLEAQRQCLMEASAVEDELRLILGRLETFAATVKEGWHQADFHKQRDIIRTLVTRVEVDQQHLRVVFRVSPTTLPPASDDAPHTWQHCGGRGLPGALQTDLRAAAFDQPVRDPQHRASTGRRPPSACIHRCQRSARRPSPLPAPSLSLR